jgi:hypothetical protein
VCSVSASDLSQVPVWNGTGTELYSPGYQGYSLSFSGLVVKTAAKALPGGIAGVHRLTTHQPVWRSHPRVRSRLSVRDVSSLAGAHVTVRKTHDRRRSCRVLHYRSRARSWPRRSKTICAPRETVSEVIRRPVLRFRPRVDEARWLVSAFSRCPDHQRGRVVATGYLQ